MGITTYEVLMHLFSNTDASLNMFKNSTLKCYKSLYEVCKMGEEAVTKCKIGTIFIQKVGQTWMNKEG